MMMASPSTRPEASSLAFLPDFTEHPKPRKKKPRKVQQDQDEVPPTYAKEDDGDEGNEITFFDDFVAGGVAGSASVIVGHPFDTMKVRMQTSNKAGGILTTLREFGGVTSLFRGMAAPLGAAACINAMVFGSYGFSSRLYDEYFPTTDDDDIYCDDDDDEIPTHDPWQKAMTCGSFAGAVQCSVICPMEHIKCRLQTQHDNKYKGPAQAIRRIVSQHGIQRLYQGWWTTALREIPAFGLYFASYDYLKDRANSFLIQRESGIDDNASSSQNSVPRSNTHTWLASAFAGGCAGSITWAVVYPVDVIKTRVQTAPLDTPFRDLRMWYVGKSIVEQHGVRYLFRGLGITLIRAFPVNGTIFPVYEFTLKQISGLGGS